MAWFTWMAKGSTTETATRFAGKTEMGRRGAV